MTQICLLRAINVSGQKRIRMADLKALFEAEGFRQVSTYIQTGNVLFEAGGAKSTDLEGQIAAAIRGRYGFEVGVFVMTQDELRRRYESSPFRDQVLGDGENVYFSFLSATPDPERASKLLAIASDVDTPHLDGDTFSLYCRKGYGRSVFSNTVVEKTLKITATTRNRATVRFLLGMAPD